MNTAPKINNAVLWKDLKTSVDLTDYITDQLQDDDKDYLTKGWIAATLEILKDWDADDDEDQRYKQTILGELAQVAKLMKDKNISYILL